MTIDFRQVSVTATGEATVNFPSTEGSIDIASAWSSGAGMVLFTGSFGPKTKRSIHTISAQIGSVAVSDTNSLDLDITLLWKTAHFNGPAFMTAMAVANLK